MARECFPSQNVDAMNLFVVVFCVVMEHAAGLCDFVVVCLTGGETTSQSSIDLAG